jgi:hypothetical protein
MARRFYGTDRQFQGDTEETSARIIPSAAPGATIQRAAAQGTIPTPESVVGTDALRLTLPYLEGGERDAAQAQIDAHDRASRSR